jgi:hypothetical protein
VVVVVLAMLSWAAQVGILLHLSYPFASRWEAVASAFGPPKTSLTRPEDAVLRCVASRLPWGLPVSGVGKTHPLFHRQSIVFEKHEARAWHRPRLRVVWAADEATPRAEAPCRGPEVGRFVVELECELLPLIAGCEPASGPSVRTPTAETTEAD